MMDQVREIVTWLCPNCDGKNQTAIPLGEGMNYVCIHCSKTIEIATASWQLARSACCPECSGESVVLDDYVKSCSACMWEASELAYEPGTMVAFVPRQAKNSLSHESVESGVVIKEGRNNGTLFVCYATSGGMDDRAKLTYKRDLYLYRWGPSLEWSRRFVDIRKGDDK